MKQLIKLCTLFLIIAPCLLLAGCNGNEDVGDMGNAVAVQFGTSNIATTRTTNGGNYWMPNDQIGIFMIANNAPSIAGNVKEDADNVPYITYSGGSSTSSFSPISGTPIYYPHNGDKVDFIAYYPYSQQTGYNLLQVDMRDQSDASKIDVLYSNNAKGYNKSSGTVDLQFRHLMSKLSFTLTSGTGSPNLQGAKVEIDNIYTMATIILNDGTVSLGMQQSLTALTAANGLNSSAIVPPQELSSSTLIVTLADNVSKFEWPFPPMTELEAGKDYSYDITVSKTGITVTENNITIWAGKDDAATPGTAETLTQYKVGDYYPDPTNSGTAIGVVFWLDPNAPFYNPSGTPTGYFGKIVSPESPFGMSWGPNNIATGATSETDGLMNMAVIAAIMNWKADYPIFSWVDSKNIMGTTYSSGLTGIWYLPAKDELEVLRNSNLVSFPNYRWSSTENTLNTTQAWSRDVIGADPNDKGWGYKAYAILKF